MGYLLGQMILLLILAVLLGFGAGWLVWGRAGTPAGRPRHAVPRHPTGPILLVDDMASGGVRVLPRNGRKAHRPGMTPPPAEDLPDRPTPAESPATAMDGLVGAERADGAAEAGRPSIADEPEVGAEAEAEVGPPVDAEVEASVEPDVEADVGPPVEAEVGAPVGSEVQAGVEVEVGPQVGAGVDAPVGLEVQAGVGPEAGAEVDAEAEAEAGPELGVPVAAQPEPEAEAGVGPEVGVPVAAQPEAQVEAEAGVGPESEAPVEAGVGAEVAQTGDRRRTTLPSGASAQDEAAPAAGEANGQLAAGSSAPPDNAASPRARESADVQVSEVAAALPDPPQAQPLLDVLEPEDIPVPRGMRSAEALTDDLRRIAGVGPKTARALTAAGITTYQQVAALEGAELARVQAALAGRGDPTRWRGQARELHIEKYGTAP